MDDYLREVARICGELDIAELQRMADILSSIKGRIYLIGLGGSLANCIHMAADLRKLCDLDAVAPDNIAELTAWANDSGFGSIFDGYLSRLHKDDALFILSVGGGTTTVSTAIYFATREAHNLGIPVLGIVGPDGGDTARLGTCVIRIPAKQYITPLTEAFQAIIWHGLLIILQKRPMKW